MVAQGAVTRLMAGSAMLVILTVASAPAVAQTAPREAADTDIIVTARRVEERLQDVPVAITAFKGESLRQAGITQVTALREAVPGLQVTSSAGRAGSATYAIRGQRSGDITVTQDPPVAVYLDEVLVAPSQGSNLGLYDIESVQVLKGPQGTLFGRNTTGGAVLYSSVKPNEVLGGYLRLGYGNFDAKTAQGAFNLPANEQVKLRFAFNYRNDDGFGTVVAGPNVGDHLRSRDELSLRFSAALDLSERVHTLFTVYHDRANNGGSIFQITDVSPVGAARFVFGQALTDAVARQKARGHYDQEQTTDTGDRVRISGINNTLTIDLADNLTFKNIFGYRRLNYRERSDFDGTLLDIISSSNIARFNSYSEEAQLQGSGLDDKLNFVAGAYYYRLAGIDTGDGSSAFGTKSTVGGPVVNSSFSGFAQANYKLTDAFTFTLGGRYSTDRRKYSLRNYTGTIAAPIACVLRASNGTPLPLANCRIDASTSFSKPTWLASIDYKVDGDTLLYVSNRRSFRSGGYNLRATSPQELGPFKPEVVTDVEVGVKTTQRFSSDWSLTANIAAYHQWYTDVQKATTALILGQNRSIITNASKAHIDGGEVELTLRRGTLFSMGFNYALVAAKYNSFPINATVGGIPNTPTDFSDRKFIYVPRHQIGANVQLSPGLGEAGELNLIANLYYQSKIYFGDQFQTRAHILESLPPAQRPLIPNDLTLSQRGYALVNARAELKHIGGTGLSAALWVRNLFDKRYIEGATIFYTQTGANAAVYGDPRTYGLEVGFEF